MNTEYFLLGDAAEVLGCQPYQITYLLATKQIQEPHWIGGRRMFTLDDLSRIADILRLELATKDMRARRRRTR